MNSKLHTITPNKSLFSLRLSELWEYKDLVYYFVKRDFVSFYKQTILGPLWYIIQPLVTSIVLYIVFTKIAKVSTGEIPPFLFYLGGNIVWMYFSENLSKTADTFVHNSGIFGKVYFPRLTVPISGTLSGLISFFIQLFVFLVFYVYYIPKFNIGVGDLTRFLFLPVLVLSMSLFSLFIGLIFSSLTTKYRDLRFVLRFGIQLWMFASPVAYSTENIPREYLDYYMLNPITPIIEGFRYIFFGVSSLEIHHILINLMTLCFVAFLSILLFNRVENKFMDTV